MLNEGGEHGNTPATSSTTFTAINSCVSSLLPGEHNSDEKNQQDEQPDRMVETLVTTATAINFRTPSASAERCNSDEKKPQDEQPSSVTAVSSGAFTAINSPTLSAVGKRPARQTTAPSSTRKRERQPSSPRKRCKVIVKNHKPEPAVSYFEDPNQYQEWLTTPSNRGKREMDAVQENWLWAITGDNYFGNINWNKCSQLYFKEFGIKRDASRLQMTWFTISRKRNASRELMGASLPNTSSSGNDVQPVVERYDNQRQAPASNQQRTTDIPKYVPFISPVIEERLSIIGRQSPVTTARKQTHGTPGNPAHIQAVSQGLLRASTAGEDARFAAGMNVFSVTPTVEKSSAVGVAHETDKLTAANELYGGTLSAFFEDSNTMQQGSDLNVPSHDAPVNQSYLDTTTEPQAADARLSGVGEAQGFSVEIFPALYQSATLADPLNSLRHETQREDSNEKWRGFYSNSVAVGRYLEGRYRKFDALLTEIRAQEYVLKKPMMETTGTRYLEIAMPDAITEQEGSNSWNILGVSSGVGTEQMALGPSGGYEGHGVGGNHLPTNTPMETLMMPEIKIYTFSAAMGRSVILDADTRIAPAHDQYSTTSDN